MGKYFFLGSLGEISLDLTWNSINILHLFIQKYFVLQEVEPMGKESDHIHIIALTSSLGIPVRVEYMDRGGSSACNHHDFPEASQPMITLLYRPGHYDILYS